GGAMRELFEEEFDRGASGKSATPPTETPEARPRAPVVQAPAEPALPLPSLGSERLPACTEPWKSLYILRRGVMPCCYGGAPLAPPASCGRLRYNEGFARTTRSASWRRRDRPTLMKIGMISLGCPKNLVDSEVMLGLTEQAGHTLTADAREADVLVVNTCAFI